MSTGATIRTPWNQSYYLTHDAYPDIVENFLSELVEDNHIEDVNNLQNVFNQYADDPSKVLNRQGSGGTTYTYTIDSDLHVTYESPEEEGEFNIR